MAGLASKANAIPLVATFHGQSMTGGLLYSTLAGVYSCFSRVISMRMAKCNIFLTQSYADSFWLPQQVRKSVKIVKTGADIQEFIPQIKSRINWFAVWYIFRRVLFLFVGSLRLANRYKGVDNLIRAFSILRQSVRTVRLMIVGGGALVWNCSSWPCRLDLEINHFHRRVAKRGSS